MVFEKLGCDTRESVELLGTAGVTEHNLMAHLGLIEQRTNQLLQMYAAAQAHQHAAATSRQDDEMALIASAVGSVLGPGPHVPAGSVQVAIVAPSSSGAAELAADGLDILPDEEEEDEEEPEDSRPFSRDELRARTVRKLARREKRLAAAQAVAKGRVERADKERAAAGKDAGASGAKARGGAPLPQPQPQPPKSARPSIGSTGRGSSAQSLLAVSGGAVSLGAGFHAAETLAIPPTLVPPLREGSGAAGRAQAFAGSEFDGGAARAGHFT
jgi:hypothetical protein